ncbi:MAG: DUF4249 domain-containing protein [Cyclobacteriaceae bacterium]
MKNLTYIFLLGVLGVSCQTEVNPDLGENLNVLVVDAWLTNQGTVQHINVTRSQPYFEAISPTKVDGATVTISDLTDPSNGPYVFEEDETAYTWISQDGNPLGVIGNEYELSVELGGVTYSSTTFLNRVPDIDSLAFRLEPENAFVDETYFAEVFATDPEGPGDTYWIKSWRNGEYLGSPDEINIAFDAAFTGGNVDGKVFIQPIRDAINVFEQARNDDFLSPIKLPDTFLIKNGSEVFTKEDQRYGALRNDSIIYDTKELPKDLVGDLIDGNRFRISNDSLYMKGDSVYVEIHSISNEAHFFLTQVNIETTREGGFAALFATPLANVSTNIVPSDPSSKVVGFFNMAAVSSAGRRLYSRDELRVLE